MLARLQALSLNHFGVAPETVNRGMLARSGTAPRARPKIRTSCAARHRKGMGVATAHGFR